MRRRIALAFVLLCCEIPAEAQGIPLSDYNLCGPNALYACLRLAGIEISRDRVIQLCNVASDGSCSVDDLVGAAQALGFTHALAVQTSTEDLSRLGVPAIVHDSQHTPPHFVAVVGKRNDEFLVLNPPRGQYWVAKGQAGQGWDGYAVLLSRTPIAGLAAPERHSPLGRFVLPLCLGVAAGVMLAFVSILGRKCFKGRFSTTDAKNSQ